MAAILRPRFGDSNDGAVSYGVQVLETRPLPTTPEIGGLPPRLRLRHRSCVAKLQLHASPEIGVAVVHLDIKQSMHVGAIVVVVLPT